MSTQTLKARRTAGFAWTNVMGQMDEAVILKEIKPHVAIIKSPLKNEILRTLGWDALQVFLSMLPLLTMPPLCFARLLWPQCIHACVFHLLMSNCDFAARYSVSDLQRGEFFCCRAGDH